MNAQHTELKAQMKSMQDDMRKKLTRLALQSSKSTECLKKQEEKVNLVFNFFHIKFVLLIFAWKKAKSIFRFAEMCRKLETEEEKILPFYASSLTEYEENDIKQALHEAAGSELADVNINLIKINNFFFLREEI